MPNNPREARSDWRQFAALMYEMFIALIEEGFSEQQALIMLGQILAASTSGGQE